tara:strand:- start:2981 stop:3952 length:972 start_codon:yes stop_codon:yes gene_type:complete
MSINIFLFLFIVIFILVFYKSHFNLKKDIKNLKLEKFADNSIDDTTKEAFSQLTNIIKNYNDYYISKVDRELDMLIPGFIMFWPHDTKPPNSISLGGETETIGTRTKINEHIRDTLTPDTVWIICNGYTGKNLYTDMAISDKFKRIFGKTYFETTEEVITISKNSSKTVKQSKTKSNKINTITIPDLRGKYLIGNSFKNNTAYGNVKKGVQEIGNNTYYNTSLPVKSHHHYIDFTHDFDTSQDGSHSHPYKGHEGADAVKAGSGSKKNRASGEFSDKTTSEEGNHHHTLNFIMKTNTEDTGDTEWTKDNIPPSLGGRYFIKIQ